MATTAAQEAAAAYWVQRLSAVSEQQTASARARAIALWSGFTAWYSAEAVRARAGQVAVASLEAQSLTSGVFVEYAAQLYAALFDQRRVSVPTVRLEPVRGGVDLALVHARAAKAFRRAAAQGLGVDEALTGALDKAAALIEADIMLAARQAQLDAFADLGVERYRRVLRPELSRSGSCALCAVASTRTYAIADLMPIHEHCKCAVMPAGRVDPGRVLNDTDVAELYGDADSEGRRKLSRTRVQVQQHGEYGPVLTFDGQQFTGPQDLAA